MGYSHLKQMESTSWSDPYERYYALDVLAHILFVRQWLNKNGIKSLRESGIVFNIDYPNNDSVLIAIDKGIIAAGVSNSFSVDMWKRGGHQFKNLKELTCNEETFPLVFAATDRVPKNVIIKLQSTVAEMLKTPDVKTSELVQRLNLDPGKTGLVSVDDSDYKFYFDLWRESEKNGGIAEATEIVKELIAKANKKEGE